jgi:hypothetical protein
VVRQLTAKDRLARLLKAINQRCKRMRDWPLRVQHQRLCRVLKGHDAYFGINGEQILKTTVWWPAVPINLLQHYQYIAIIF